jgi:hypothetical protein
MVFSRVGSMVALHANAARLLLLSPASGGEGWEGLLLWWLRVRVFVGDRQIGTIFSIQAGEDAEEDTEMARWRVAGGIQYDSGCRTVRGEFSHAA